LFMKIARLNILLIFIIQIMLLASCKNSQDLSGAFGVSNIPNSGPAIVPKEAHRLKIFRVGQTTSVGATSLTIGDTLNLRAVLVDSTGALLTEVDVSWYVSGGLLGADLFLDSGNAKIADFTPSQVGSGHVQAVLNDADIISQYNVVTTTAAAGTINAQLSLTPDQIIIVSGNNQTSQVGSFVPADLKVKVVNAGNTPVPGVNVTFSVLSGGGQIISVQPSVTDAFGEAVCDVKLGGQIGANQQTFSATISSGSITQVVFSATAVFGPAAKLAYYLQPGGANQASAFSIQPIIEVQDSYGNRVTNASNSITLSTQTGSGTLAGATTMSAVNGLATFTNVSYDTAENGVVIRAASAGLTSSSSQAFNVGSIIVAAQCAAIGSGWSSTDGGCKNATQGLVWSASSVGLALPNRNWHNVVWDATTSGSASQETWQQAPNTVITMDATVTAYDTSGVDYCQSLNESGLTDWRVPTWAEWSAADVLGAYAALKNSNPGVHTWTGTTVSSTNAYGATFTVGATGTNSLSTLMTATYAYRCVRRPPATKLLINQQVSAPTRGLGVNAPFENTLIVRAADNTNSTTTSYNGNITLGFTGGTGLLCYSNPSTGVTSGCATTQTMAPVNGVATFTNLTYSKAETIQLIATAPPLTSVTGNAITINQTYPKAQCLAVGGTWINGNGGCKNMLTGRIYSAVSNNTMTWYEAIWDQATGGNGASQKVSDNARTHEYGNATTGFVDISPTDYCHDLQESGQTDWRLPGYNEYNGIGAQSVTTYTKYVSGNILWTNSTNATPTIADYFIVNTGEYCLRSLRSTRSSCFHPATRRPRHLWLWCGVNLDNSTSC
jgi:hypothetical protein